MESTSQAVATTASQTQRCRQASLRAIGRPVRDEPTPSIPGITSGPRHRQPQAAAARRQPGGQSMAGGVPGAQRKLEYKQPLPGPGTVLGVSDANASSGYPGQLGLSSPEPSASPVFGAPDLQSPSFNPGLLGPPEVQSASQQAAQPSKAPPPQVTLYLSQISDDSLEVLEHFGAEAPNPAEHLCLCR